ncbi:MAG: hypothetical protein ACK4PR_08935, partial [Gammaproteobacteria bacterium]
IAANFKRYPRLLNFWLNSLENEIQKDSHNNNELINSEMVFFLADQDRYSDELTEQLCRMLHKKLTEKYIKIASKAFDATWYINYNKYRDESCWLRAWRTDSLHHIVKVEIAYHCIKMKWYSDYGPIPEESWDVLIQKLPANPKYSTLLYSYDQKKLLEYLCSILKMTRTDHSLREQHKDWITKFLQTKDSIDVKEAIKDYAEELKPYLNPVVKDDKSAKKQVDRSNNESIQVPAPPSVINRNHLASIPGVPGSAPPVNVIPDDTALAQQWIQLVKGESEALKWSAARQADILQICYKQSDENTFIIQARQYLHHFTSNYDQFACQLDALTRQNAQLSRWLLEQVFAFGATDSCDELLARNGHFYYFCQNMENYLSNNIAAINKLLQSLASAEWWTITFIKTDFIYQHIDFVIEKVTDINPASISLQTVLLNTINKIITQGNWNITAKEYLKIYFAENQAFNKCEKLIEVYAKSSIVIPSLQDFLEDLICYALTTSSAQSWVFMIQDDYILLKEDNKKDKKLTREMRINASEIVEKDAKSEHLKKLCIRSRKIKAEKYRRVQFSVGSFLAEFKTTVSVTPSYRVNTTTTETTTEQAGALAKVKGRVEQLRSIGICTPASVSISKRGYVNYAQTFSIGPLDPGLPDSDKKAIYEKAIENAFSHPDPVVRAREGQLSFLRNRLLQPNLPMEIQLTLYNKIEREMLSIKDYYENQQREQRAASVAQRGFFNQGNASQRSPSTVDSEKERNSFLATK